MNKALLIRELLAVGKSPNEVASVVDCHPAYVRSVRAREAAGGDRPSDRAWKEKKSNDPNYKKARVRYVMKWKRANRETVRAGARRRYAEKKAAHV